MYGMNIESTEVIFVCVNLQLSLWKWDMSSGWCFSRGEHMHMYFSFPTIKHSQHSYCWFIDSSFHRQHQTFARPHICISFLFFFFFFTFLFFTGQTPPSVQPTMTHALQNGNIKIPNKVKHFFWYQGHKRVKLITQKYRSRDVSARSRTHTEHGKWNELWSPVNRNEWVITSCFFFFFQID